MSEIDWNRPQPAPLALWLILRANLPWIRNLGIYNRRNVAGTSKPSTHSEGRALDIGLDANKPKEKHLGDQLFKMLIECAPEMKLDHVIWNREIWSDQSGETKRHTGTSPHTDHVHVAFTREGSQLTEFKKLRNRLAVLGTGLGMGTRV